MGQLIDLGVNFEDATKTVPDGTYKFQVARVDSGQSKGGTERITFWLEIIENADPLLNGQTVPYNCGLAINQVKFIANLFQAVGATWNGTAIDPESLIGKTGMVVINQREYEGQFYTNVKKFVKRS